jgi:hypothetical protein
MSIPAIKVIDKGELDDYVLKDGKWMMWGEDSEGEKDWGWVGALLDPV